MFYLIRKQLMFYIVDIRKPAPLHFSSVNSTLQSSCESTTMKKTPQVAYRFGDVHVSPWFNYTLQTSMSQNWITVVS